MANTYSLISSYTVGAGGAATVSFTGIPSTYTDLLIKVSCKDTTDTPTDSLRVLFNSDTTTSYYYRYLQGNGSIATSASNSGSYQYIASMQPGTYTANVFDNTEIYIPNYAGSNYKPASSDSVVENNATAASAMRFTASIWNNTSAITSMVFYPPISFAQYSSFYLYGIKNS